jgi:hypothetical protein
VRWVVGLLVLLLPRVALGEGPSELECTAWLGAGGGSRLVGAELFTIGEVSAGLEMTGLGVPFGNRSQYGGSYELRSGPWVQGTLASREALAEGGWKWVFTQLSHAPFGTYDIRVGGGVGTLETPTTGHVVFTATGGVRSFPTRYRSGRPPPVLAVGSVLRLYLTTRVRLLSAELPWQITGGIEVEPSFLGPPYSWQRLAGARY